MMKNSDARKFIKSNVVVTTLSLVLVAVSFVSQMVIAYYFGANTERDAYFSAIVVPTYIVTLFLGSFTTVILPFFVDYKRKNDLKEVNKLISNMLGLCTALLTSIAACGFMFSDDIVSWIAPGFTGDQLILTRQLFEILIFTVIFQSLSSFLAIFYHTENRFLLPALNPIITPVVSFLFVIVFADYGIKSLAVGALVGSVLGMTILLIKILNGMVIKSFVLFINRNTLVLLKLSMPLFLSGAVYRLTTIVERIVASNLPPGSISYLGYGSQIYLLLASIASGSITTTFYPLMSEAWSDNDSVRLNDYLSKGFRLILFITLPIGSVIIALAYPIVEILFERGEFNSTATAAVSLTLSILMGAFIFGSLANLIVKIFYITKRTISVAVISSIEVLTYIVAAYFLSLNYSYRGLATALTLSMGLTLILLIVTLLHVKLISLRHDLSDVLKLFVAAALCGISAHLTYSGLSGLKLNTVISTGGSVFVALCVYLAILSFVFKPRNSKEIINIVKNYF